MADEKKVTIEPKWRAFLEQQITEIRAAYEIFNRELSDARPAAIRRRAHALPYPDHFASILEVHARLDTIRPLGRRLALVDAALTCTRRMRGRRDNRECQLTQSHCTRAEILIAMRDVDGARRARRAAARYDRHAYGLLSRTFVRALICDATGRGAEAGRLRARVARMNAADRAVLPDLRTAMSRSAGEV
jgi:hypothetical protein